MSPPGSAPRGPTPSGAARAPGAPPWRAVLFDLDYTLFDQRLYVEGALRDVAAAVAAERGQASGPFEHSLLAVWRRLGTRHPRLFDTWATELAADLATDLAADLAADLAPPPAPIDVPSCVRIFHAHAPVGLTLYPGTAGLLRGLRRAGLALGVVTDGDAGMQEAKVRALGVRALVDVVVFTKALGAPKPDPAGLQHALATLGVAPADAVYIGDHPALDVGAARAAGVHAVRVLTGEHATLPAPPGLTPDLVATDLTEALAKLGLAGPISPADASA